jgi:CHAT domain-containing protein
MSIDEIRARMPAQAQILQYAVLQDEILIWVVSKDEPVTASQSISVGDLNKRVNAFLQLVSVAKEESTVTAFRHESMYLYDLLIKPVEGSLDRGKQLCIVPDKILNYLPFAALRSEQSGKFFIEEQERGYVLSPSSNIYVLCSDTAREKESTKGEKLLCVGNPLFDSKSFPDLAELRSAVKEVNKIAGYYDSADPIIGALATKQRVMSEMEKSDVIHLATHAIADEWNPLRSKLVLAGGASAKESDGVLQAYEIYKLNLARAKLVVLSACQTGVEKYYRGEGMIGLARPFIAKRIPQVVATLWEVDSDSAAELMISFHRHRKSDRLPTADALRRAQCEMIGDSDSSNSLPCNWASFVAIGGYTSF